MIKVFLRGGLGNQMFQYAAGLNLAKKNNTELVLDTVHLQDRTPRKNFSYRDYDLGIFTFRQRFTLLSHIAKAIPIPAVWLGFDMAAAKVRDLLGLEKFISEKSERFDPAILDASGNIFLFGRWQSENYFKDIRGEVRSAFHFRIPLEGEAKEIGEKIGAVNSVSLHVRRGDFAAFENVTTLMGDTNLSYYASAATYIAERFKNPEFFIFSDDIEWCKQNIKLSFPTTYVSSASEGPKASFHLELMALCKHNIIANSTFSWWGAWLNNNPEKIVVAPKQWYADGRAGAEDIVPERWIRI
jgi:hypothetical protein